MKKEDTNILFWFAVVVLEVKRRVVICKSENENERNKNGRFLFLFCDTRFNLHLQGLVFFRSVCILTNSTSVKITFMLW